MNETLIRVKEILSHITMSILGKNFTVDAFEDKKWGKRIYIQVFYEAPDTKTGVRRLFNGAKWYLSDHSIDDEIVKRAYAAFEAAVKHEVMEGFKYDNVIVFNPHVDFMELINISHKEVSRAQVIPITG